MRRQTGVFWRDGKNGRNPRLVCGVSLNQFNWRVLFNQTSHGVLKNIKFGETRWQQLQGSPVEIRNCLGYRLSVPRAISSNSERGSFNWFMMINSFVTVIRETDGGDHKRVVDSTNKNMWELARQHFWHGYRNIPTMFDNYPDLMHKLVF